MIGCIIIGYINNRKMRMNNVKKKILLIHGWNYENYNNYINTSAWNNRSKFVNALEENAS